MPCSAAPAKSRRRRSCWEVMAAPRSSPRPERISISEEMSSPAIAVASAGSDWAPSRSASKRGTSPRPSGSRSANSSSRPTVRSVEASKAARALSRSMSTATPRSGQVEVERVEKIDRWTRGVHGDLGRNLEQGVGIVEDDLHSGVCQVVSKLLGRGRRDSQNGDDDVLLLDDVAQLGVVAHGERADLAAHDLAIGVEDGHDAEAVVSEDVRGGDRGAEMAGAEEGDVVLPGRPEDLAGLGDQGLDVVAHPPLAELAKAREVAADLRRVDVRVVGQLLGGDRLLADLAGLGEDLEVARESRGHPERELLPRFVH